MFTWLISEKINFIFVSVYFEPCMPIKILGPKWLLVFLPKEENAYCLILSKSPVWGTPGTILHTFCTQIHGKGSQLALKEEHFLILASAPENRGSTRCPCWMWLGQAPNGHQLERETVLVLGRKVPVTNDSALKALVPKFLTPGPPPAVPVLGSE